MANKQLEQKLQEAICKYLDLQYPNVIYTSDLSGIKLTIGSAVKAKKTRCKHFKIPDLLILEPNDYHKGLFFEIKKDKSEVYLKNGDMSKSKHIFEQNKTIQVLRNKGYKAMFVWDFNQAKTEIDNYIHNLLPF